MGIFARQTRHCVRRLERARRGFATPERLNPYQPARLRTHAARAVNRAAFENERGIRVAPARC